MTSGDRDRAPDRVPTGHTTRVMVKSRKEIEDELEKLSKEYIGKKTPTF